MNVHAHILRESKGAIGALRRFIEKLCDELFGSIEAESGNIIADIYKAIQKVRYDNSGGLREIAHMVSLSPSYVSMIFKQQTGENIIDCISRLRLERAKQLLRDQSLKVYEICEMIGYTNQYYFSAWFKKNTGVTPSEYRRMQGRE